MNTETQTHLREAQISPEVTAGAGRTALAELIKDPASNHEQTDSREAFPYLELFNEWSDIQKQIDDEDPKTIRNKTKRELIERQNDIQSEFMFAYAGIKDPKDRDKLTATMYRTMPDELKDDFVNNGMFRGVINELYVLEQLLQLEDSGYRVSASSPQEDISGGFDIKIEDKNGGVVLVDVKSRIPHEAHKFTRYAHNFGSKFRKTMGQPNIYVICPNPPEDEVQKGGIRFTKDIKFPEGSLPSFQNNPNRPDPNSLAVIFAVGQQVHARQQGRPS